MITLFFAIFVRALSGWKNAFHYMSTIPNMNNIPYLRSSQKWLMIILSTFTLSIIMIASSEYYSCFIPNTDLIKLLIFIPVGISWFMMMYVFYDNIGKALHTAEYLLMVSWTIIVIILGADILALGCGMYLGLALFNMPIQWVSTGKWINKISITDDPTGKTTGYWIGPYFIQLSRFSNGYVNLIIGLITSIGYCLFAYFYPEINVNLDYLITNVKGLFECL